MAVWQVIAKPKWCAAVIVGTVVIGSWAQSELPTQRTTDATDRSVAETFVNDYRDYLEGQPGPFMIPRTGDPEIDQACLQAVRDVVTARNARRREEGQREHMRKRDIWQGTTAVLSQRYDVSDAQRESAAPFVELFATDPPAPAGRRERFAEYLQPDSPDRCVGWHCQLKSAEEVDDGRLVDVEVIPNLMGLTPKTVFTFSSTYEVWHVSRDGKLTPVDVTPGDDWGVGRM